nr:hypothetical protein [uncultured Methanospirillum sp.]
MAVLVLPSAVAPANPVRLYLDSSEHMIPALVQSGITGVLMRTGVHNQILIENLYGKIEYIQFFGVGVIVMAIFMTTMMGGGTPSYVTVRWESSRGTWLHRSDDQALCLV